MRMISLSNPSTDSKVPQGAKAYGDHPFIGHGAGKVADGLSEAVETDDRFVGNDRVLKRPVALDDARDQHRGIRGKFSPAYFGGKFGIGAQRLLRFDDGAYRRRYTLGLTFDEFVGRNHTRKRKTAHFRRIVAAAPVDEDLARAANTQKKTSRAFAPGSSTSRKSLAGSIPAPMSICLSAKSGPSAAVSRSPFTALRSPRLAARSVRTTSSHGVP